MSLARKKRKTLPQSGLNLFTQSTGSHQPITDGDMQAVDDPNGLEVPGPALEIGP
jgi:hypothetical protein